MLLFSHIHTAPLLMVETTADESLRSRSVYTHPKLSIAYLQIMVWILGDVFLKSNSQKY